MCIFPFLMFITTSHFFLFCFGELLSVVSPAAIISSHASVSAAVFTLPVYSCEAKDDLKRMWGRGTFACGHWWGKAKTTDGLYSVFNPDSTSIILSSLQECPHCMLNLTRQVTIRI